jgi:Phage tail tube protein
MAPSPTWRTVIGVAKESMKGTPVVPTVSLPVGGFTANHVPTILLDEGMRGSPADSYGSQHGKIVSEIEIDESPLFVDSFNIITKGILGDETVTGTSPYTHAHASLTSGDQQPPALTLTEQDNLETRAWPGTQLSEVKLTIDPDGNITYTASGMGFPDATASTFVPAFTSLLPMQGWRMTCALNGTTIQPVSMEVTLSREVNAVKTANNSQSPFAIWVGKLTVDVSGNFVAENTSHVIAFAADTQGVLSITGTRGAGATTETLTFLASKAAYNSVEKDRGNDWIEYALELHAHHNSTDVGTSAGYSPCKLTLVNALTAAS